MDFGRLIRKLLGTAELLAAIGLVGLLVLGAVTMADVVMRWLFNSPIFGMSDLAELVVPAIVASCLPAAFAARQNITIRFLGRAIGARPGQTVELFGQMVVLLVLGAIVWQVWRYTAGIIRFGQTTWLLGVPLWPTWGLTTALVAACLPIQLLVVAETVHNLVLGRKVQDHVSDI